MKSGVGESRRMELVGIEMPSSPYQPDQLAAITRQLERGCPEGGTPDPARLPPAPPGPRLVWQDSDGSNHVVVDEGHGPKARRYAVGSRDRDSGNGAVPCGYHSVESSVWAGTRSPRYQPDAEAMGAAMRERCVGLPADPNGSSVPGKGPAGGGGGGDLDLTMPMLKGGLGGMAGALFSSKDGESVLESMLKGGASGALSSALMGVFGKMLGGMIKADDSDALGKQLAAKFAIPAAVAAPSMAEKFLFPPPAPAGVPVCRGMLSPGPAVFVESLPMGLVGGQVLDVVPSIYLPPGAPKVLAGGIPMAVSTGQVLPQAPPGPPTSATPMIHARTVTWAAPAAPKFTRADGKVLENGDTDFPLNEAPMSHPLPEGMADALRDQISGADIQDYLEQVGFPADLAAEFNLDDPQGRLDFFSRYGPAHYWNDALGWSASLNEYFAPKGFLGGLLNRSALALQGFGKWSGLFELGSPAWPGAGTGSMWYAPDRIGSFSISRLFIEHDADYGHRSLIRAEGTALLNALRQNPNVVGLVYGTGAVIATTLNGLTDPEIYRPF